MTLDNQKQARDHNNRDAETLKMLGIFMGVLSLPVLIATFWAGMLFAMGINFISGLILLGVGVGFWLRGKRLTH